MNVHFNKTANHIHEIYINGFKAGLILLLSHHPDIVVDDNQRTDWRVFFWGKYDKFQINYRELGLWPQKPSCNTDCTLTKMKEDVVFLLENNKDQILPKHKFQDKGFVFAHNKNGKIYTINKEYQDDWSEHFSINGNSILFDSRDNLEERVKKLFDYEKRAYNDRPDLWSINSMLDIEYRMVNAMFDTSYYNSIKD